MREYVDREARWGSMRVQYSLDWDRAGRTARRLSSLAVGFLAISIMQRWGMMGRVPGSAQAVAALSSRSITALILDLASRAHCSGACE